MRPLRFEEWRDSGLWAYRYIARDGPAVERSWGGLSGDWPEDGPTPFTEYAVNNNNREEVAIYLGLIWRLTEGLAMYGVPRYWRDDAMYAVGAPYALIDWEYEVENEEGADLGEIRGFVPARSSVRSFPPPSLWEREQANRAGLFELPVFGSLRYVVSQLLGDATAELNIFALKPGRVDDIAHLLRDDEPPSLTDLFAHGEMLIDLNVGVDAGYCDTLVIQAAADLTPMLGSLVDEYEAAIARYEEEVEEIESVGTFIARIDELLNLGNEREAIRR